MLVARSSSAPTMSATSIPRAGSPWLGRWRALATPTNSRHARRALRTLSPSGPADLPRTSPSRRSLQGTCWPPARLSMTSSGSSRLPAGRRLARLPWRTAGRHWSPIRWAPCACRASEAQLWLAVPVPFAPTPVAAGCAVPRSCPVPPHHRRDGRAPGAVPPCVAPVLTARPLSWRPPSRAGSSARRPWPRARHPDEVLTRRRACLLEPGSFAAHLGSLLRHRLPTWRRARLPLGEQPVHELAPWATHRSGLGPPRPLAVLALAIHTRLCCCAA